MCPPGGRSNPAGQGKVDWLVSHLTHVVEETDLSARPMAPGLGISPGHLPRGEASPVKWGVAGEE
jgi:hypothetical protein